MQGGQETGKNLPLVEYETSTIRGVILGSGFCQGILGPPDGCKNNPWNEKDG